MKVVKNVAAAVSVAVVSLVLFGCASAASLANRKDTVGSIKKLSKMLIKNSEDQEAADVFNELYNREMANKMYIVQSTTASDILNNFAAEQGAPSVEAALKAIVQNLPDRTNTKNYQSVVDDYAVKEVINRLTELKDNYRDLTEIQSAVSPVPETIGSVQTYYVEKYTNDFNSGWTRASDDLGDFYLKCGDAMLPAQTPYEIGKIADIYKKAETAYFTQSKISSVRNTLYTMYMDQGDQYLAIAKQEIPNIARDKDRASDPANMATIAYSDALSYKSNDSKAKAARKEATYYYGVAQLTAAEAGGYTGAGAASYAEAAFGSILDYKDSRDRQKDARALVVKEHKKGECYYCSQLEYDSGKKHNVITYNKKGQELTVNGEDFYSLSNVDQITYRDYGGYEFILWDGDFDYRRKGKSQLSSTGLVGETILFTYKKDADGTIHAYNSYNREIYTFTTPDAGQTYVYVSDTKWVYTFTKY